MRRLPAELFDQKQEIQQNEVRQLKAKLVEMRLIIERRAAKNVRRSSSAASLN